MRKTRRLCLFALSLMILIGSALHGQVYRWDTAEKISDTVPEPYADFRDQILDYAALDGLDLYGAYFERASLVSAHLMGSDLRHARFEMATLINADLSDAIVQWACFTSTTDSGFTAVQLYSTASYQNNDLTGIGLSSNDMTAWNFADKSLTGASFSNSTLTAASFSGAIVQGTQFSSTTDSGFTAVQLYSTASYQGGDLRGIDLRENDLSGWDFAGKSLTDASFSNSTLTAANFSGAIVQGTQFSSTTDSGFTAVQLYSTASYQNNDLTGIGLSSNDMTAWNFAQQNLGDANLTNANLNSADLSGANLTNANLDRVQLSDADLSRADTRGAFLGEERIADAGNVHNLIFPDGNVKGLEIIAGQTMRIGDYEGNIAITIEDIMTIDPLGGLKMIFEDDMWDSTISFETSIDVTLAGALELLIADDIDPTELVGVTFHLFDWTGVNPVGAFDLILTQAGTHWDTSALYTTGHITLIYAGSIIFVDADATGGANNGTNWENAYLYLQDALDDPCLVSGGEILVAAGTYRPDEDTANPGGSGDRRVAFHLKNGVTIKGGYAGYGQPNPNARDVELYKTILSGDLDGNDVQVSDPCDLQNEPTRAENSYHVVIGSGEDSTAVIDGFTITGGNANGSASLGSGGGMFNYNGNPTVTNCILSGNSADSSGGGMYNYKSSPMVTNCTLTGNYAVSYGGSIYNNDNSSPTVTNCMFEDNKAGTGGGMYNRYDSNSTVIKCTFTGNSASSGGGMYNILSRPNVTDCTFSGNISIYGGGMYNYNNNPTVTNCNFSGNNALYGGGGMRNENSNPTVTKCTFSDNSSGSHAGGIYNYLSSPTLINCTFIDNEASNCGGGLFNMYESSPTVTDCAFAGNSADYGGGIYNQNDSNPEVISCTFNGNSAQNSGGGIRNDDNSNSTVINCAFVGNEARYGGGMYNPSNCNPEVINCTFSGNSANSYGGGMYNYDNSPTVTNCIFWDNRPNEIYNSSSTPTITYSDIKGGYSGIGNLDADPCFVDDSNPDPNLVNLRLRPGSPCIDVGNNSEPNLPLNDLDGHPRIIDGNCDGSAVVDMGAYEFDYTYMGDLDYNCRVDFFDFSLLARFWQKQTIEQDYNYDGLVDFYDWAYFADFWDGDYYELSLFLDQWLTQTAAFVDIAPQSGDNIVDWQDVSILCNNWLTGIGQ